MTPDQMYSRAFPVIWLEENGSASITKIATNVDSGGYTRGGIALGRHPEISRARLDAMVYVDFYGFYKVNYWTAPHCNLLPWPLALVVFDGEVNAGNEGAKALQLALGVVPDGDIGPKTLAAVAKYPRLLELTARTCYRREDFYRNSGNFRTYGEGWLTRLFTTALSTGGP